MEKSFLSLRRTGRTVCVASVVQVTLVLASSGHAAVSLSSFNTYAENFDALATSNTLSNVTGTQVTLAGTGWEATRIAGSSSSSLPYNTNNGGISSPGIYSYGLTDATDRALGSLANGSHVPAFGVAFTNNTGSTITGFTLIFDGQEYRTAGFGAGANTLTFAYGVSGGAATNSNYLTTAFAALAAGNIVGTEPVSGFIGAQFTQLSTDQTVTVTGLNVPDGQSMYIRWSDVNDGGSIADAGLAINNVRFTPLPAPAATALLGMGGLFTACRRRQ